MHGQLIAGEVKREFGTTIRRALDGQPGGTLYKSNILDLYGELFYSGAKVVKLQSLEELPELNPVQVEEFKQEAEAEMHMKLDI